MSDAECPSGLNHTVVMPSEAAPATSDSRLSPTIAESQASASIRVRIASKIKGFGYREADIETPPARIVNDVLNGTTSFGMAMYYLFNNDRYESGPNRGEYKWKNELFRSADNLGEALAMSRGLPYYGTKSIIKGMGNYIEENEAEKKGLPARR